MEGSKALGPDHRQKRGRWAARCSRAPHGGRRTVSGCPPRSQGWGGFLLPTFVKTCFYRTPIFKAFPSRYPACCCQKFIQATFRMPSWCTCLASCLGYRVPPANLPKLGSTEAAERNECRMVGEGQARTPQQRGTGTSTAGAPFLPALLESMADLSRLESWEAQFH